MYKLLIVLSLIIDLCLCGTTEDDLVVTLLDGSVRGREYVTGTDKVYYGFHSIPYAAPPVGDLRLETPQKPEKWSGVLNGTVESKTCVTERYLENSENESEDCLYMNVYTPSVPNRTLQLPVMIFIYGGAFNTGDSLRSSYAPDYLIEKDVIVVTFNYRLGPFGFATTADEVLPGNFGLKDQNLALQWTRDNILFFGGDPEKITVFGQSAGAGSIALHLLSKKSAGLFDAAIMQSASALSYWSAYPGLRDFAFELVSAISPRNYNDSKAVKDVLKKQPVENIMRAYVVFSNRDNKKFFPVLEVNHEDAFIAESHYDLFQSGKFNQVPTMIGLNNEESLFLLSSVDNIKARGETYDSNPVNLFPLDLKPNASDEVLAIEEIKKLYLGEGQKFASNMSAVARHFSDYEFNTGVLKQAELASNFVPVYLYEFSYFGDSTFLPVQIDGKNQTTHGSELQYLFSSFGDNQSEDDLLTQNRMVTMWTNFAKYQNPIPNESELFENITWPPTNPNTLQYLNINKTLEVKQGLKGDTYGQWNDIYEAYGQKPFITF